MTRELTVIRHLPGDSWDPELGFRDQPGIDAHVQYWSRFHDEGKVVLGGPFPDGSGGMIVLDLPVSDATSVAFEDPAVHADLLYPEVRLWRVVFDREV